MYLKGVKRSTCESLGVVFLRPSITLSDRICSFLLFMLGKDSSKTAQYSDVQSKNKSSNSKADPL